MSEKGVVRRSVVIALGIICVILAVGIVGAIANYTSVISGKDNTISSQDSQISSLQTQNNEVQTWLDGNKTYYANEIASKDSQITNLQSIVDLQKQEISTLQFIQNSDVYQSGLLLPLPYGATWMAYNYTSSTFHLAPYPWNEMLLLSLDVDQNTEGNQQTVFVRENSTINVTGTFQTYTYNPGNIYQLFFIYSWTPSYPPSSEYYHVLYNGSPGSYPGVTQSFNFTLTIPDSAVINGRICYLYFCSAAQLSIQNAINTFTEIPFAPYAVIVVCN